MSPLFDFRNLIVTVAILIGCLIAYVLFKLATSQLRRLTALESDSVIKAHRQKRADTLQSILNNVAKVVLLTAAVIAILSNSGLNVLPVIAGASVLGVAIGFGAQSLIRDYLVGILILTEDQFNIGDQVTIGSFSGEVSSMTLRTTILRDPDGNVHVIPNGRIEGVTVHSREWSRATVDITVAYREELGRVLSILSDVCALVAESYANEILEPPELLGVHDLSPRGPSIRVTVKTKPGRHHVIARDLRRRIKHAFDEMGVKFAVDEDV